MQMASVRCGKQAGTVAARLIDFVGSLEGGDACPVGNPRRQQDAVAAGGDFQPVVETANHDRAGRKEMVYGLVFLLAAAQSALDCLGDGDGLRHGEGDGGVDGHAAIGRLFERFDACGGHRYFDLNVGRQSVEMDRLFDERLCVAVEGRAGLHREPTLAALLAFEDRHQHGGSFQPHRFDQTPGDPVLGLGRIGGDDTGECVFPGGKFFLEHVEHDAWIGRRADGSVADGVSQFLARTRVIPVVGGRRADGTVKRAGRIVVLRFCSGVHRFAFRVCCENRGVVLRRKIPLPVCLCRCVLVHLFHRRVLCLAYLRE